MQLLDKTHTMFTAALRLHYHRFFPDAPFLKKYLNASKPSNQSKSLSGNFECRDKKLFKEKSECTYLLFFLYSKILSVTKI